MITSLKQVPKRYRKRIEEALPIVDFFSIEGKDIIQELETILNDLKKQLNKLEESCDYYYKEGLSLQYHDKEDSTRWYIKTLPKIINILKSIDEINMEQL